MKKASIFKTIVISLISVILSLSFSITGFAEGNVQVNLSSNVSSIPRTGTFTVNIKLSITDPKGLAAIDNLQLTYDKDAFDFSNQAAPNKNFIVAVNNGVVSIDYNNTKTCLDIYKSSITIPITFKAKSAATVGNYQFAIKNYEFYSDTDGEFTKMSHIEASSLTVSLTDGKSNNSLLKNLTVTGYELSPNFNKTINTYNLTIPDNLSKIAVVALPDDINASVTISGENSLTLDVNPVLVVVTAPDGSTNKYTINVRKGAANSSADTDYKALAEKYENKLKDANLRNLIITIILIFIILALLVYILLEKYGSKWFKHSKEHGTPLVDNLEAEEDIKIFELDNVKDTDKKDDEIDN